MVFEYKYPRAALTVDCIIFGLDKDELKVMLIQRDIEPFKGQWALPGGFVHVDETLEDAARRELSEETGITNVFLEQLYTFGDVTRDPRERVVSVAYYALINLEGHEIKASSDARSAAWFSITDMPPLAFDHELIFDTALQRLKGKIRYQPIGFELLPKKFTLSELQTVYELILEKPLDKRNFRKKILSMDILKELNEIQQDVSHRAARLYSFDEVKYRQMVKKGFLFEI
jgi:8-oxo-dGTP diphosphatase